MDVVDDDLTLVMRCRDGDAEALSELLERHRVPAVAFATWLAGPNDAEDLVADAFARIIPTLRCGEGPATQFRGYLRTTIRNLHVDRLRRSHREVAWDDALDAGRPGHGPDESALLDGILVGRAFRTLPEHWRQVLFHTEVLGDSHQHVADLLGTKPTAVRDLGFRGREALRKAFLAEHLPAHLPTDRAADCATPLSDLPALARRTLHPSGRRAVEDHLDGCDPCRDALDELERVNARIA